MFSEIVDTSAQSPRSKLFWATIAAAALALLGVFYSVCRDQVRKGEAREADYQAQRLALTDCIQYRPNTTIGSCARLSAQEARSGQSDGLANATNRIDANNVSMTSAVPVNFAYR